MFRPASVLSGSAHSGDECRREYMVEPGSNPGSGLSGLEALSSRFVIAVSVDQGST